MVEQKLPKPLHIKNNHYSCTFLRRENVYRLKNQLNQGSVTITLLTPLNISKADVVGDVETTQIADNDSLGRQVKLGFVEKFYTYKIIKLQLI